MDVFKINSRYDGLELSVAMCEPGGDRINGIVQIVHGMCEHKERYFPFMEWLAEHGYASIIHDHRGHGASIRNEGDLGYMYDGGWKAMFKDVETVGDVLRCQYPGKALTLLGHSMGSMVVRSYMKRFGCVKKLIVCGSPSNNPAKGFGRFLAGCACVFQGRHSRPAFLDRMAFGSFNRKFKKDGYKSAWVCSDKTVLEAYHNDPLCQFIFTANGFWNLFGLMRDCYSTRGWNKRNTDIPVLFISGAEDPCMGSSAKFNKAIKRMMDVGYKDVSSIAYDGMRHEILNETRRQVVWDDVLAFIKR